MLDQVTESVPGAREMLAGLVPALSPETNAHRDVSGEVIGPEFRQQQVLINPGGVSNNGKSDKRQMNTE